MMSGEIGFLTRFLDIFGKKIQKTQKDIEEVLAELGWNEED